MNNFDQLIDTAFDLLENRDFEQALAIAEKIPEAELDIYDLIAVKELKVLALEQLNRDADTRLALHEELFKLYEKVFKEDQDGESEAHLIRVADILFKHYAKKDYKKALNYLDKLIQLFENSDQIPREDKEQIITGMAFQGAVLSEQNNFIYGAKKYYKKITDGARFSQNPDVMVTRMAAHYQLGNIFMDESKMHDAIRNYKKVLRIHKDFQTETEPSFLASVYNNLAIASKTEFLFTDAVKYFQKALDIYLNLARQNPDEFLPFAAMTYVLLGNTYVEKFDVRDEIDTFGVSSFSGFGILSVPNISDSRKTLQQRLNKEEGVDAYKKALEIFNRLYEKNPGEYRHYVAMVKHNLGIIHDELERYEEARQWYEEAMETRKNLARENPEIFMPDLAVTLLNLLTLHQNLFEQTGDVDHLNKARAYFEEVTPVLKSLDEKLPVIKSMKSEWEYFDDYFKRADQNYIDKVRFRLLKKQLTDQINETTDVKEKLKDQYRLMHEAERLMELYPDDSYFKEELTVAYTNLFWFLLRDGQMDAAGEVKEKYFDLTEQASREMQINLTHEQLIKGNKEKAEREYIRIIENDEVTRNETLQTVKRELQLLALAGLIEPQHALLGKLETLKPGQNGFTDGFIY